MRTAVIALLLALSAAASAQRYETKMLGCVGEDKIDLRWAPADYETWRAGNKNGYTLERFTIMRNGEILEKEEIANEYRKIGSTFRPAPLEDWEPYADNKYAAIAAECIYGEEVNIGALTPQAAYKIHQRGQQKFSFALYAADMNADVAWLSGLSYTDKNVHKDEKYLYKIYVNDTIPQDTAMVFINSALPTPMHRIPNPKVKWGYKTADISVDLTVLKGVYTSYDIERSTDGGKSFATLSDISTTNIEPLGSNSATLHRRDTLPDNNALIIYRVYGTDCFGRKSEPALSDEGHGLIPLVATPRITRCGAVDNNRVEIEWAFPDSLTGSAEGFRVYKQSGPKSRFRKIYDGNDPKQRSYVDRMPGITNYYKISVYNQERENLMTTIGYAALVDSLPPASPRALEGGIDSTGIATIRWRANNESDLAGYRVYTANAQDDIEFSLLTPTMLTDTVFKHKVNLNTLTHEIFYQVRAIDKRDNHSAPSQTLRLMRPDTIAPVAPFMKPEKGERGRPSLQWICSSSDDVARHYLLRKTPRAEMYDTVAVFTDKQQEHVDKTAAEGQDYVYAIMAEDSSGNKSKLSSAYFHTDAVVADIVKIRCRNSVEGNKVTWSITTDRSISEFIVYRTDDDGRFQIVAKTSELNYMDKDVRIGNKYTYGVKIMYADGTESGVVRNADE